MVYYTAEELMENSNIDKKSENSENIEKSSSLNNGGTTDYYALPSPTIKKLVDILEGHRKGFYEEPEIAALEILELFPQTLNNLIEYKNMKPWQHEVFKACYALEERAMKNPDAGSSRIREINKILYYTSRGLKLEQAN